MKENLKSILAVIGFAAVIAIAGEATVHFIRHANKVTDQRDVLIAGLEERMGRALSDLHNLESILAAAVKNPQRREEILRQIRRVEEDFQVKVVPGPTATTTATKTRVRTSPGPTHTVTVRPTCSTVQVRKTCATVPPIRIGLR